jgi:hypothetical protein
MPGLAIRLITAAPDFCHGSMIGQIPDIIGRQLGGDGLGCGGSPPRGVACATAGLATLQIFTGVSHGWL